MVRFEHCPKGNPNSTLALGGHRWSLHQTFSKSKHWATAALCWNYYDCWWAFVAKQFWRWCFQPIQCFSEARTFLPDAKKRFYPYPVVDSFGWFMPVSASQSDGTKSCKFEDFQVISCGITMRRCEDLLVSFQPCYSWSFGARTFLEVGGVFSATTKINAFQAKTQKEYPKGIGIINVGWQVWRSDVDGSMPHLSTTSHCHCGSTAVLTRNTLQSVHSAVTSHEPTALTLLRSKQLFRASTSHRLTNCLLNLTGQWNSKYRTMKRPWNPAMVRSDLQWSVRPGHALSSQGATAAWLGTLQPRSCNVPLRQNRRSTADRDFERQGS